jgi:predicted transcriptional regulator
MANFYHNTLNEEESNELRIRMEKAESDTFRVYEMAKTFKTLWRWKTVQLHHQIYKQEIQESVAGRALNDLCAMGYLVDTGERIKSEKGGRNFVYEVCDVEPVNPIKIPKSICVKLQFIEDEDGNYKLDMEKMSEEFISKLDHYDDLFNN